VGFVLCFFAAKLLSCWLCFARFSFVLQLPLQGTHLFPPRPRGTRVQSPTPVCSSVAQRAPTSSPLRGTLFQCTISALSRSIFVPCGASHFVAHHLRAVALRVKTDGLDGGPVGQGGVTQRRGGGKDRGGAEAVRRLAECREADAGGLEAHPYLSGRH